VTHKDSQKGWGNGTPPRGARGKLKGGEGKKERGERAERRRAGGGEKGEGSGSTKGKGPDRTPGGTRIETEKREGRLVGGGVVSQ